MGFVPIAIIGRGLVLPGVLSPDALWSAVKDGRDLITDLPADEWPDDPASFLAKPGDADMEDKTITMRAGVVSGFDAIFNPADFAIPAEAIVQLEPAFQWLLHSARNALHEARRPDLAKTRSALVVGNLSYPIRPILDLAEKFWLDPIFERLGCAPPKRSHVSALNRFSSGYPAHILAQALRANGPAFCLDAACASSLYALKYACDYLAEGEADIALAAAANACDSYFLHIGFTQLRALSPSGTARPFSRRADGLLPARGAAAICLKRLADAERDGDAIFAVIRGIGLSNDGSRTVLNPDADGQVRAMRQAYVKAGIDPKTVSLVECHATGTPVGDRTELESLKLIYDGVTDLPVGSLKSNLGHLITVAGLAGIVKVTSAMAAQIRPPSLNAEDPIVGFAGSALRVLQNAEPWPETASPRCAGLNNFGFGGNNAHVVIEEHRRERRLIAAAQPAQPDRETREIAICGLGVIAGETRDLEAFSQRLFDEKDNSDKRSDHALIRLQGLRFPPKELQDALGQHSLIFEAAQEAVSGITPVASERAGVFIGMGCDVDAARPGMRLRVKPHLGQQGFVPNAALIDAIKQAIGGAHGAQIPLSSMPNLPANRINAQNGWKGIGFTVSSEELSGLVAVELAMRALAKKELDLALAGAVDLSVEPVHREAADRVLPPEQRIPGDAAIAFVLKRREDAERCGDPIYATLSLAPVGTDDRETAEDQRQPPSQRFGHAHAASGVVEFLATIARFRSGAGAPDRPERYPASNKPLAIFRMRSFSGQSHALTVLDVPPAPRFGVMPEAPHIFLTAADTLAELCARLERRQSCDKGAVRIAFVAADAERLQGRIAAALKAIGAGRRPEGPGIYFGDAPFRGELAFVYSELGAPYPGAYKPLCDAFPEIVHAKLRHAEPWVAEAARTYMDPGRPLSDTLALAQAGGSHAVITTAIAREVLGLKPQVALGVSMGESNMLAALGAWRVPHEVMGTLMKDGFYRDVEAPYPAIVESWGLAPGGAVDWQNWWVHAPIEDVRGALAGLSHVHMLIINSPEDCIVGGDAAACAQVVARISAQRMTLTSNRAALHCPPAAPLSARFRAAHLARLQKVDGIRFYFNAVHRAVNLTEEAVADLLMRQSVECVDLPKTVRQAHADGVRIFLEIGPRAAISHAIATTLADKPHLSLSLDHRGGKPLFALTRAAATLFAAGVPIDMTRLCDRLAYLRGDQGPARDSRPKLRMSAHLPNIANNLAAIPLGDFDLRRAKSIAPAPEEPTLPMRSPQPPPIAPVAKLFDRPPAKPRLHLGPLSKARAPDLIPTHVISSVGKSRGERP